MGLLGVLLLPVTGPMCGVRLFAERLRDEAEAVLCDEGRGFAELLDLSMRRNAGKISDAEFAEEEAALLARLSSMRDYRNELLNAELDVDEDALFENEPDADEFESLDAEPDLDDGEC